jgi:hypothetical protein
MARWFLTRWFPARWFLAQFLATAALESQHPRITIWHDRGDGDYRASDMVGPILMQTNLSASQ